MTDHKQARHTGADDDHGHVDSEAALQEHLRRESAEHADLLGDTSDNRNLSGSTTWETLPEENDRPARDAT